jgi:hypothetical protein
MFDEPDAVDRYRCALIRREFGRQGRPVRTRSSEHRISGL